MEATRPEAKAKIVPGKVHNPLQHIARVDERGVYPRRQLDAAVNNTAIVLPPSLGGQAAALIPRNRQAACTAVDALVLNPAVRERDRSAGPFAGSLLCRSGVRLQMYSVRDPLPYTLEGRQALAGRLRLFQRQAE